ncbi:hypothetical protein F4782DRAFT_515977 [Xylaria castorea]|nr:hypothetical protein F4782DRAFT_515977 [Xylaria castorea]
MRHVTLYVPWLIGILCTGDSSHGSRGLDRLGTFGPHFAPGRPQNGQNAARLVQMMEKTWGYFFWPQIDGVKN